MFARFMNQAKLNKLIKKQKQIALTEPDTGYSAIISACLEEEAKGTFRNWPDYMKKSINEFYQFAIQEFGKTDCVQKSLKTQNIAEANEITLVLTAVSVQALVCKDLSDEELRSITGDVNNLCKVFVNLKLLPERFLNDEVEVSSVA